MKQNLIITIKILKNQIVDQKFHLLKNVIKKNHPCQINL